LLVSAVPQAASDKDAAKTSDRAMDLDMGNPSQNKTDAGQPRRKVTPLNSLRRLVLMICAAQRNPETGSDCFMTER
jgi:hypothetical protein